MHPTERPASCRDALACAALRTTTTTTTTTGTGPVRGFVRG